MSFEYAIDALLLAAIVVVGAVLLLHDLSNIFRRTKPSKDDALWKKIFFG